MKVQKSKMEYSKQEEGGEYKYDATWKRDIELSGDEINPIVVYSDSDVEQYYPKQNQIILEPLQQYEQQILHFLDDPGVTIRLGKYHLINLFMAHSLITLITERTNSQLYEMILTQVKNPDVAFKETKKKKYKEQEIYAWIGMNMMMKVYQLPKVEDYWKKELYWLRGGIDSCLQKGRFDYLQQNLLQSQNKNDKFMDSLRQVKKSCRNLCRPDQEIVALYIEGTYYCIDTDTQFILDYGDQDILLKFKDKNHVIYCYFPISLDFIYECQIKNIFLCGYYNKELVGDWKYGNEIITDKFVQPYMVLVDRDYYQRFQELQTKLDLKIDKQQNYTKNRQAFEHYLQVVIYNCQKLRGESKQQIAKGLLGEKMTFLERDRKHILIQNGQPKQSIETLTDPVSFGLRNSYENTHTPHIQSLLKEFKICPVCAKYKSLKKAYFRCEKCELTLVDPQRLKENLPPKKIFLCAYPCFEFFHQNPSQYIDCAPSEELTQQGENKYFKWKQEVDIKMLNEEKQPKKDKRKQIKPVQFNSISKEAYKDQYIIEDEDLVGILNSLNKQDLNKPVEDIQPIITSKPIIETSYPSGHKRQLQQIEDRFDEERRQKEKMRIEMENREQQEYEEQILLERLERQEMKKKNKKQRPQEQKQKDQKNKRKNQEPEQNYIQDFLRNHYNAKQEEEE